MGAIGTVGLKDFDRGMILTLGSQLIDIQIDSDTRKAYALSVPSLTTDVPYYAPYVPVFFTIPEDVFQQFRLPCVVVRRNDLTPAFERSPYYGYQRTVAPDAKKVMIQSGGKVLTGYNKYVSAPLPTPFDISYDIQVYARTQNTGIPLLMSVLKVCRPPFFSVAVFDSLGDKRLYDAGEVSVSDGSELADIADRTISWTISFSIRGELDLEAQTTEDKIVTTLPNIGIQVSTIETNVRINAEIAARHKDC